MHDVVYDLIKNEDYQCYNDGSYQHDTTAFDQLGFGWPRSLISKLGIRFLNIRK